MVQLHLNIRVVSLMEYGLSRLPSEDQLKTGYLQFHSERGRVGHTSTYPAKPARGSAIRRPKRQQARQEAHQVVHLRVVSSTGQLLAHKRQPHAPCTFRNTIIEVDEHTVAVLHSRAWYAVQIPCSTMARQGAGRTGRLSHEYFAHTRHRLLISLHGSDFSVTKLDTGITLHSREKRVPEHI